MITSTVEKQMLRKQQQRWRHWLRKRLYFKNESERLSLKSKIKQTKFQKFKITW